jgi:excisionase family DNA binding protein
MIMMDGQEFLSAQEACQVLGVKAATLYAYVSRGLLTSYRQGIKRARLYRRTEVEYLTRLRGPSVTTRDQREVVSSAAPDAAPGDAQRWIPYL